MTVHLSLKICLIICIFVVFDAKEAHFFTDLLSVCLSVAL